MTGSFLGTVDFDPDPIATDEHTSTAGSYDIFITKFLKEPPTSDEGDDVSDDSSDGGSGGGGSGGGGCLISTIFK